MNRRSFLGISLAGVSGVAAFLASIPFVKSFLPSAKAKALGDPVEIDLTTLRPGDLGAYLYRGRTMLVLRRTEEMLTKVADAADRLLDPDSVDDPLYVQRPHRSINREYLVVEGVCTHLGCVPQKKDEEQGRAAMGSSWSGGFICPCHRSGFDYAGRVVQGPAPTNLRIPPHKFVSPTRLVIGEATELS